MIAACSTHAVNVLVDISWRVEENDNLDVLQIQTSCGQVRGDEETSLARIEFVELRVALGLR